MKNLFLTLAVSLIFLPLMLVLGRPMDQTTKIHAETLSVCPSGCAYSSIQAAIDAAAPGDSVAISSGVYTESLTLSKPVSLIGANAEDTVINAWPDVDGWVYNRVLTVTGAAITNSVIISGLTFAHGFAYEGGGIYIGGSAQPLLQNLVLFQNKAHHGGGFYGGSPVLLVNLKVVDNSAYSFGGGGYLADNGVVIGGQFVGNRVTENFGSIDGGTIGGGLYAAQSLTLSGTLFSGNVAFKWAWQCRSPGTCTDRGTGGGVFATGPVTIVQSRFEDNWAYEQGTAVSARSGGTIVNSVFACNSIYSVGTMDILNTTLACPTPYGDAAIDVNGQAGITNTIISGAVIGLRGQGSIWEDYNLFSGAITSVVGIVNRGGHSFQGDPHFANPALEDYHLSLQSPAIDAGVNTEVAVDFDGDRRPQGASTDIGFDEFAPPFALYLPLIQRWPAYQWPVYYQIIAKSTGQCLDVLGASTTPQAAVITYPCDQQDNQTWLSGPIPPEASFYDFQAKHSQQCLDVLGASFDAGAQVVQWPCHQTYNQLWQLEPVGNNYYRVKARHSNLCLDANGPVVNPGGYVRVIQNGCQNVDSQLWKFEPRP